MTLKPKQINELTAKSEMFLKNLGITQINGNSFSLKKGSPHFNSKPINNLIWQEKRVLGQMIEKRGGIFEFGPIEQIIFKNEEDYSLWAISKFIQRLREKLEANSIAGNHIQTVRKRGYVLR